MGVLITSADGHIALAAIRSLGKKGIEVTSGSYYPQSMCFQSKYLANRFMYPDPNKDECGFIDKLVEVEKANDFDVLFLSDSDVLLPISHNRKKLSQYTTIPLPSNKVVEDANNKAKIVKIAKENDIPFPKTYFSLDNDKTIDIAKELKFPVVIKPYVGAGSSGLTYVNSTGELAEKYKNIVLEHGPALIQEYIRGTKIGFSGLFNMDSELRSVCVYQHIREYPITGGPMCAGKTIRNDDIISYGIKLLQALKWYGVANIEFIVDDADGVPKVLDVNPRFFAGLPLTIAAGVDYPYLFYKMIKDGDIDTNLGYNVGVMGRSIIMDDRKHMFSVLKGAVSPKYNIGKVHTLINYLKFYEYDTDYIFSLDDPGPALSELMSIIQRKTKKDKMSSNICRVY